MGFTSSEEGMRFVKILCGTYSDHHRTGMKLWHLIKLRWLTDDENSMIAYWDFYGKSADHAQEKFEKKMHDISLVCDGYTVHEYSLAGGVMKYQSTSCHVTCRPETEETDDES